MTEPVSPSGASPDDPRPGGADPGTGHDEGGHDETGLDLARATARSLAGAARVVGGRAGRFGSRRRRPPRVDPQASGAHPDDRDPQPLQASLSRLVAEQGWDDDIRVHAVFARWSGIVGPEVAQHTTPVSFQPPEDATSEASGGRPAGGRLVVRTDSTAWATQMRLLAPTVVRRLNEELGDGTVALIDVEGPAVPSWKRGRRSVRGGRGPRDTYG